MQTRLSPDPASPVRTLPYPGLGSFLIGKEEEELVLEVLRSGKLFRFDYRSALPEQGTMTTRLENEFRQRLGVPFALAVTSGTAALETALGALGVGPGDEVILPAWSWVSCFTSVVRLGALPVLAEVDDTFCLKPGEIARLATSRTKAVIVVHYQGVAAEMEPILAEAKAAGIRVLEDCAESAGALYHGGQVGSLGDIAIFSFQFQKMITSGEGGLVATRDPLLYERAIRMHDLGKVRPYFTQWVAPAETDFCGSQFRMSELTAAVALAQSRKLDLIRTHCRGLNQRILAQISDLPGIGFRKIPDPEGDIGFELYLFLETVELAQAFAERIKQRGIWANKMTGTYCHYRQPYCVHRKAHAESASPFARFGTWPAEGYRPEDFPVTEELVTRFVALPIGMRHTEEDADYIAEAIRAVHEELLG